MLFRSINFRTIGRLFGYLKPHMPAVTITLLLMAVTIGVELFNPWFLKLGIDKYIANGDGPGILMIGGVMIVLNVVMMYCARFRMVKMSKVTNDILLTIRQQLYTHIQKLSFSFFDSRPVGDRTALGHRPLPARRSRRANRERARERALAFHRAPVRHAGLLHDSPAAARHHPGSARLLLLV